MKKCVFLVMFLLIAMQAFAVSWDDPYFTVSIKDWENPVWIKNVKANTIYTYYEAMFGPGEVKLLSPLPGNPTGYFSDENRTTYGHRAYLGYIMALAPNKNLGVWVTHDFRLTDGDGSVSHLFASGNFYIQDTTTQALSNEEALDVVYTHGLSDAVTLGFGFNYNNNDFIYDGDYTTTSFLGVGPRDLDFTARKNANYFGSSLGLAYTPTDNFGINFGLEGGGFFGTRHYEESRFNYVGTGEIGHFNHDGDYDGYRLKAEADGYYRINNYWRIPFRVSYGYGHQWDSYEGLGTFSPTNLPYFREDDREYRYHQAKVKVGVEYFPRGNWDIIIPLLLGYGYDNDRYRETLVTDYTALPGGTLNDRFTDTTFSNNTLGVTTGVVFPLWQDLKMSTLLRYSYTFVNTTARANISTGGTLISTSRITEPGHEQALDGIIGLTYTKTLKNSSVLAFDLFGTIPILNEADYTTGVPDSDDNFPQGSVRETSFSREYRVFLGISYSF